MANEGNLKPAKKGEVRNPAGKPPGTRNRSTIVRELLSALRDCPDNLALAVPSVKGQLSTEEVITLAQIERAANGDTNAYKAIMDSAYGAPKQDLTSDGKALVPPVIQIIAPKS